MNKLLLVIFVGSIVALLVISFFQKSVDYKKEEVIDYSKINHYEGWETNFQETLKKSKESKKNIMMVFSGTDWCQPCKMLDQNVFETETFKSYAIKNLELLLVDFPQEKPMTEEEKAQNNKLSDKYKIEGFPTVVVINSDEVEIARMSYLGDRAEEFIKRYVEKIKDK